RRGARRGHLSRPASSRRGRTGALRHVEELPVTGEHRHHTMEIASPVGVCPRATPRGVRYPLTFDPMPRRRCVRCASRAETGAHAATLYAPLPERAPHSVGTCTPDLTETSIDVKRTRKIEPLSYTKTDGPGDSPGPSALHRKATCCHGVRALARRLAAGRVRTRRDSAADAGVPEGVAPFELLGVERRIERTGRVPGENEPDVAEPGIARLARVEDEPALRTIDPGAHASDLVVAPQAAGGRTLRALDEAKAAAEPHDLLGALGDQEPDCRMTLELRGLGRLEHLHGDVGAVQLVDHLRREDDTSVALGTRLVGRRGRRRRVRLGAYRHPGGATNR